MNKFKELNDKVLQLADEKGILEHGTKLKQCEKTFEECLELRDALTQWEYLSYIEERDHESGNFSYNMSFENQSRIISEIRDAIGVTLVTLIIQAKMNDMDIVDCLEIAYNEIAGRTGEMKDGVFVKD